MFKYDQELYRRISYACIQLKFDSQHMFKLLTKQFLISPLKKILIKWINLFPIKE